MFMRFSQNRTLQETCSRSKNLGKVGNIRQVGEKRVVDIQDRICVERVEDSLTERLQIVPSLHPIKQKTKQTKFFFKLGKENFCGLI